MVRVHVLAASDWRTRLSRAWWAGQGRDHQRVVGGVVAQRSPGNVNYTSTKAWQRVFIESLSLELRGRTFTCRRLPWLHAHWSFISAGMDKRRIPGWWWMSSAERVVADLLRALGPAPVVVVPGIGYRLAVLLIRFLPRWLWRAIVSARRGGRGSGARAP
jgi:short-subunit dehydrogenase